MARLRDNKRRMRNRVCRDCGDSYATKMRTSKYCFPCRDERTGHKRREGRYSPNNNVM